MMRIAVSQRVEVIEQRGERRDALDQRLCQWMLSAGLLPCPAPNVPSHIDAWLAELAPHGVLLSGGNDIGTCPERDATERALIAFARARSRPLLGICRGMQMLGLEAGGTLQKIDGHVATTHAITGEICGEVNSFHGWALSAVPDGYRALARSSDGAIEAIAHVDLDWEGWMWHPERRPVFSDADLGRLRRLFAS